MLALAASIVSSCSKKIEFTYTEAEAAVQDVTTSVTATGTIEPVTSVDVGTQVSGIVSKLYVDYNSVVKAGQIIAELDRTNLMSELSSAQANLKSAQSDLDYQKTNYERFKALYDKGLISANDFEQARLSYIKAQQTVTHQRDRQEGTDKPRLCHHHQPHRRRRAEEGGGRRTDRRFELQHADALHDCQGPDRYASDC
jgi:HlyD family secretion protein